jgi:hypothetical protein
MLQDFDDVEQMLEKLGSKGSELKMNSAQLSC